MKHEIDFTYTRLDARGRYSEQLISRVVPEAIIDELEAIQIQEHER